MGIGTPRGGMVQFVRATEQMLFDTEPLKSVAGLTRGELLLASAGLSLLWFNTE